MIVFPFSENISILSFDFAKCPTSLVFGDYSNFPLSFKNGGIIHLMLPATCMADLMTQKTSYDSFWQVLQDEYICKVEKFLDNPVYQALVSGNRSLALGTETVKYFAEAVSPFVGFQHDNEKGFGDLHDLLPSGRKILYASPLHINQYKGWQLLHKVPGLQFIFDKGSKVSTPSLTHVPLQEEHTGQMMQLTALTKPGPFGPRTIDFGNYFGFFENGQLVAMTGQRLHVHDFAEISAVCTHPDHLGKGYASALVQHQIKMILDAGETPFLHVREDNLRAIEVYRRLGFRVSGPMNFYFLKREE